MALFKRDKDLPAQAGTKTEEKPARAGGEGEKVVATKAAAPKETKTDSSVQANRDLSSVIVKPHITEKAVGKGDQNVYTFIIHQDATKYDVMDAVKALFKVTPTRVNIVRQSPRSYMSRSRGRRVTTKGMKKAYVYLKAGDSIELA